MSKAQTNEVDLKSLSAEELIEATKQATAEVQGARMRERALRREYDRRVSEGDSNEERD